MQLTSSNGLMGVGMSTLAAGPGAAILEVISKKTIGKSRFIDVNKDISKDQVEKTLAILLIGLIIYIVVWILISVAIYRLTDSVLQGILCFIFGTYYMGLAILFYGFTDHKFCLVESVPS
jgi:uncharacterized membrane protein YhaH (DUF805 family)